MADGRAKKTTRAHNLVCSGWRRCLSSLRTCILLSRGILLPLSSAPPPGTQRESTRVSRSAQRELSCNARPRRTLRICFPRPSTHGQPSLCLLQCTGRDRLGCNARLRTSHMHVRPFQASFFCCTACAVPVSPSASTYDSPIGAPTVERLGSATAEYLMWAAVRTSKSETLGRPG